MTAQRARILEAAMELFLDEGYDRVSVEKIATSARVSKSAIYDQFGGKEPLFDAVIGYCCEGVGAPPAAPLDNDFDLADVLFNAGQIAAYRVFQPKGLRIIRLVLGSYNHNPKLARIFWEHGPVWAAQYIAEAIAVVKKRKRRRNIDPHELSIEFLNECVGAHLFTVILGVAKYPTHKEIDKTITRIVDDFIERHRLE